MGNRVFYTEAQKNASRKYNEKSYDRIDVKLHKGKKAIVVAHVERIGESLNGFINRAIFETIERDALRL